MLNEEKIILMTKLASYEKGEGRKYVSMGKYFRSDYITLQVLKSVVYGTIAFALVAGVILFYDFEFFMQDIYKTDLLQFGKRLGIIYVIAIGIYALISYVLAIVRYNQSRQSLRGYYSNLKKLSKFYE